MGSIRDIINMSIKKLAEIDKKDCSGKKWDHDDKLRADIDQRITRYMGEKVNNIEEIFDINSKNITSLVKEYFDSISPIKCIIGNLDSYSKHNYFDKEPLSSDKFLCEKFERDSCGEELGESFRSSYDTSGLLGAKNTYDFYYDENGQLRVHKNYRIESDPSRSYCAEDFHYRDNLRYGRSVRALLGTVYNTGFSYYHYLQGHVADYIVVRGPFGGYGRTEDTLKLEMARHIKVTHVVFDKADYSKIISKRLYEFRYVASSGIYRLKGDFDLLNPPPQKDIKERVIDTQKKLCNTLEKAIKVDMSLNELVDCFFDVIKKAKPNEEEMLLFEVGCFTLDKDNRSCMFSLLRQTPTRHDEFYQMHLDIEFEASDDVKDLSESEWHEQGDPDLREYVLKSEAFAVLKEKKIKSVKVWVDET